jgi:hypothetical protein
MSDWTVDEIQAIGDARELEISSRRRDGTLSPQVTIWAVRVGDDIYIRSVNGPDATWYRGARARAAGRVWSGGIERDVRFEEPAAGLDDEIDNAYRAKFGAESPHTQAIITPVARGLTVRVIPKQDDE